MEQLFFINKMKKLFLSALFSVFIFNNINAQTYAEYFNQFPLITKNTTWDANMMENYHTLGKPKLDDKFLPLVGGKGNGKGKWATKQDVYMSMDIERGLYPLGRVEVGNCVYVFIFKAPKSDSKDTQCTIDMFFYEKKTGNMMQGGVNFMFAFFGGISDQYQTFKHKGSITTDGKTLIKVEERTDEPSQKRTLTYKLKSSGTDLISNK